MRSFISIAVLIILFSISGFAREEDSYLISPIIFPPDTGSTHTTDTVKRKEPLKMNIVINGGVGLPAGKFSVNYFDYLNSTGGGGVTGFKGEGGFAAPGSSFNLCAEYALKNSFLGITGNIGYYRNQFNMNDYAYGYNYNSPVYYNSFTIMPGLFAGFSDEKVSLVFRISAGLMILQSPNITYSGDSIYPNFQNSTLDTATISRRLEPATTAAFAFSAGMSIRFKITEKWFAGINIDYMQAFPTLNISSVFAENGISTGGTGDVNCPYSLINLTVAFGYHIGN